MKKAARSRKKRLTRAAGPARRRPASKGVRAVTAADLRVLRNEIERRAAPMRWKDRKSVV